MWLYIPIGLAAVLATGPPAPNLGERTMADGWRVVLVGVFRGPALPRSARRPNSTRVEGLTVWTFHDRIRSDIFTLATVVDSRGREYEMSPARGFYLGPTPPDMREEFLLTPPPELGKPLRLRLRLEFKDPVGVEFELPNDQQWLDHQYDAHDPSGWMAEAVARGDLGMMRVQLDRGAHANVRDSYGFTALMVATISRDTALAGRWLDSGAARDLKTQAGATALFYAAWIDDADIATLLLQRGADPNLPTVNRDPVIRWAKSAGMKAVLRAFGARGCGHRRGTRRRRR